MTGYLGLVWSFTINPTSTDPNPGLKVATIDGMCAIHLCQCFLLSRDLVILRLPHRFSPSPLPSPERITLSSLQSWDVVRVRPDHPAADPRFLTLFAFKYAFPKCALFSVMS